MNLIISSRELFHLISTKQKNLRIVDTRSFNEYLTGHIPGALNIELMQYHWNDTSKPGIKGFNIQMRQLLSNLGISEKTFLVFYDNISGPSAARGVWLSLYFSHEKVAMLDGGYNIWKKEKKPTDTKTEALHYCEINGTIDGTILANYKILLDSIKSKNKNQIIDARTSKEYNGEQLRAIRGGHIPSAINIDWKENISIDKFKSLDDTSKLYSSFSKHQEIITYCQGGYRAANTFVILKELGFKKVKMYLGSWNEWGNNTRLPIE
ncbi:MAG TPA: rhodanese-like domain-containing protein [Nitrososphaeraceae archaeon]|nr:rhodanese-like domain-containing protein [Nitrososphaeraceae archaeon]